MLECENNYNTCVKEAWHVTAHRFALHNAVQQQYK